MITLEDEDIIKLKIKHKKEIKDLNKACIEFVLLAIVITMCVCLSPEKQFWALCLPYGVWMLFYINWYRKGEL